MRRIIFTVLLGIVLVAGISCGGSSLDEDTENMLRSALTVTTGTEITELKMDREALSISYEHIAGDDTEQFQRWLNMSAVAISFMDEPRTIIIYPQVDGEAVSRVTIEAGDVAELLPGDTSFEQALSKVRVETLD